MKIKRPEKKAVCFKCGLCQATLVSDMAIIPPDDRELRELAMIRYRSTKDEYIELVRKEIEQEAAKKVQRQHEQLHRDAEAFEKIREAMGTLK